MRPAPHHNTTPPPVTRNPNAAPAPGPRPPASARVCSCNSRAAQCSLARRLTPLCARWLHAHNLDFFVSTPDPARFASARPGCSCVRAFTASRARCPVSKDLAVLSDAAARTSPTSARPRDRATARPAITWRRRRRSGDSAHPASRARCPVSKDLAVLSDAAHRVSRRPPARRVLTDLCLLGGRVPPCPELVATRRKARQFERHGGRCLLAGGRTGPNLGQTRAKSGSYGVLSSNRDADNPRTQAFLPPRPRTNGHPAHRRLCVRIRVARADFE